MAVPTKGFQGWRGEVRGEQAGVPTTSSGRAKGRVPEKGHFPGSD